MHDTRQSTTPNETENLTVHLCFLSDNLKANKKLKERSKKKKTHFYSVKCLVILLFIVSKSSDNDDQKRETVTVFSKWLAILINKNLRFCKIITVKFH